MVAFDTMKDKLLSLDEVQERISFTEPLTQQFVSSDQKVHFAFDPTWAIGLEDKHGTSAVDASITIDGTERRLTKDAALQVGAEFGYPGKLTAITPSALLEQNLNYWWNAGMGDKEFNVLSTGADQHVAALTRPTINPFSNRLLVQETVDGIRDYYGQDTEIYADYKFNHSLIRTDIRFIIPDAIRLISGGGLTDIPDGERDEWSGGIHLTNSLIGKSQTKLETYLFRWWCTNGATTQLENIGQVFSRRGEHQTEDVYDWAREAVNDVLGGFESQFDTIQALTSLKLGSNTGEVVSEIFDTFNVPVTQRKRVIEALETAEELNMYVVMNAITQTANDPDLSDDRIDKILRIGGAIPGATFNSIKARLWEEGHTADSTQPNPYRLHIS